MIDDFPEATLRAIPLSDDCNGVRRQPYATWRSTGDVTGRSAVQMERICETEIKYGPRANEVSCVLLVPSDG
jgi:hypothetical protein